MKNWINENNKKRYTKINGLKIVYNKYQIIIYNPQQIKDFNKILNILNKFLEKTDFIFKGDIKYLAYQWISYNILLPQGVQQYTFKNTISSTKAKFYAFVSFFSIQRRRFVKWKKKNKKMRK